MRVAPHWQALALAAAALLGFVAGVPSLLREGAPVAEAARGRATRREETSARAALPPPATTPAEVRDLLRWCEEADASSVPALRSAVASGDPLVAGNALRALGRLGALDAGTTVALLEDPRSRVRQEAVLCLGSVGGPVAIEALARIVEGEDPELRPLAIRSLREIGSEGALAVLEERLRRPGLTEAERAFAAAPRSRDRGAR